MAVSAGKLSVCAVASSGKATASVLFLHGSGDTGPGVRAWVRDVLGQDLSFNHIRVLYPTAPLRPYTPMGGGLSNVWFDRYKISQNCPEHTESIEEMCGSLGSIIQEQVSAGIPKHRMVIGGFSMGGAMALQLVCRYHGDVAGVFAMSSFLNADSAAYTAVRDRRAAGQPVPELLMSHGNRDELVLPKWGRDTASMLQQTGMPTVFQSVSGLNHELSLEGVEGLKAWILTKLPPIPIQPS